MQLATMTIWDSTATTEIIHAKVGSSQPPVQLFNSESNISKLYKGKLLTRSHNKLVASLTWCTNAKRVVTGVWHSQGYSTWTSSMTDILTTVQPRLSESRLSELQCQRNYRVKVQKWQYVVYLHMRGGHCSAPAIREQWPSELALVQKNASEWFCQSRELSKCSVSIVWEGSTVRIANFSYSNFLLIRTLLDLWGWPKGFG